MQFYLNFFMKKIIIIRHGKSSWKHNVDDRKRPLKTIGIENTIKVCKRFKMTSGINLKNVFSSPAKRALDTCRIFVENYSSESIIDVEIVEDLYDFDGRKLRGFITALNNDLDTVFVFGHNNALNNFVNSFGNTYIENIPTSGLVVLEFNINNWADLQSGILKLKLFPKEIN